MLRFLMSIRILTSGCQEYSFSAKKVKDDGDITQAGIASHISADIYGLQVLESRIQNNKNNATRFIIVSAKGYAAEMRTG